MIVSDVPCTVSPDVRKQSLAYCARSSWCKYEYLWIVSVHAVLPLSLCRSLTWQPWRESTAETGSRNNSFATLIVSVKHGEANSAGGRRSSAISLFESASSVVLAFYLLLLAVSRRMKWKEGRVTFSTRFERRLLNHVAEIVSEPAAC